MLGFHTRLGLLDSPMQTLAIFPELTNIRWGQISFGERDSR